MTDVVNENPVTPTPAKRRHEPRTLEAQLLQTAELLGGIQANSEQMTEFGFDTAFVTELHSYYQNTIDTHHERLAHKARMMEKTKECLTNLQNMTALYTKVRKRIKLELPKETWREFGIVNDR